MIPVRLSVENFLCYREGVPALDFTGIHLACLCGPNGHGKSTLLDCPPEKPEDPCGAFMSCAPRPPALP